VRGDGAISGPHARTRDGSLLSPSQQKTNTMLYTAAVVIVLLWLLGIVTGYTVSGLIHILLVIAVIVVLLRVIEGRKILR